MAPAGGATPPTDIFTDRAYAFYWQACRARFRQAPEHYVESGLGSTRTEIEEGANNAAMHKLSKSQIRHNRHKWKESMDQTGEVGS